MFQNSLCFSQLIKSHLRVSPLRCGAKATAKAGAKTKAKASAPKPPKGKRADAKHTLRQSVSVGVTHSGKATCLANMSCTSLGGQL